MERLTKRSANGTGIYNTPSGDPVEWENNRHRVLQKLADYEDLEEQGLLLRLPCKVGDTVWCIYERWTKCTEYNSEFDEYSCQGCEFACDSYKEKYVASQKAYSLDWIVNNLERFKKIVFLTQAEAEEALRKMKESEE